MIDITVNSVDNPITLTVAGDETILVHVNSSDTSIPLTIMDGIGDVPNDDKKYIRKNKTWNELIIEDQVQSNWNQIDDQEVDFIKNKPSIPTKNSLGLDIYDSPEFANNLITTLASGEAISADKWTWLNGIQAIVPKSVLSILSAIITYLFSNKDAINYITNRTNQTLTGPILLDRDYTQYNSLTLTGALELSVGANPVIGGFAEGIIVGNGTNTPTLNGITKWPTSADFDPTNNKHNKFTCVKFGGGVYINWTQMN